MNSLWGVLNNHPNGLPVEGCQHHPMGVYLKCMIGGVCTKSLGFMDPCRGGVENTLVRL